MHINECMVTQGAVLVSQISSSVCHSKNHILLNTCSDWLHAQFASRNTQQNINTTLKVHYDEMKASV